MSRRKDRQNSYTNQSDIEDNSLKLLVSPANGYNGFINGVQLSQSATNISAIHPSVPPASPVGQLSSSLNPSPVLSPRIATPNKKYLLAPVAAIQKSSIKPIEYPKIVVSTRSLPESLTSDHDDDGCCRGGGGTTSSKAIKDDATMNELTGKYATKFRHWKVPKFLRKLDETLDGGGGGGSSSFKKSDVINCSGGVSSKQVRDEITPCLTIIDGGYQALPIVIETPCPPTTNSNCLDVPNRIPTHCSLSSSRSPENSSSPGPHSMFDEIIDVRSYISQSRSDISPFGRSGSYRSQNGRANNDVSPMGRPRALTVHSPNGGGPSGNPWDILSICPSAHSRKDSGIRSNSRRSSIQQQIYVMNQSAISQQRVSGYFTSSQSSLAADLPEPVTTPAAQNPDPLGACLQQLRKQSDLQLIRCVRDNAKSQRSYLVKPPLSSVSLFFKSKTMEREFRGNAHRFGCEIQYEGPPTLATPKYNTYIDIIVGMLVYFAISASLFLLSITEYNTPFRIWISLFSVFTVAQFLALFIFTKQICHFRSAAAAAQSSHSSTTTTSCDNSIFEVISSWYPWHICLSVLMSFPVILIIINFSLQDFDKLSTFEYHYGFLIFVCIIHFCNFTQLNCWMRNVLAVLTALAFVGIALGQLGAISTFQTRNDTRLIGNSSFIFNGTQELDFRNGTDDDFVNRTQEALLAAGTIRTNHQNSFQAYHVEIYLDLILVLILVWFLNRQFEIGYRLTFYGNAVANKDKIRVQNMKNQADMLLHNIIPKHVAEHLKNTAKYSENHHNIGIIFASIINFNELYDESYLGGKEYLRVLNELIGDFDELLSRPEFRCVEKIKTIGSTFMAASGLDPSTRGDNSEHIFSLMNFAIAMQSVVDDFNKDLLEFNLILRIGLNVGDVTAGVIGTSKLHYDIWGDAVNVASRMDSTGVAGRIQVGKLCVPFFDERFEFELRGKVYVKGKDHMEVCLMTTPKTE